MIQDRLPSASLRRRAVRRGSVAVLCGAAFASAGCSGFVNFLALPFIMAGANDIQPQVKLVKDKRGTAKVLAFTRANADLRWGHDAIDEDLTAMVTGELAKDKRHKLVRESEIRQWRDTHPRWELKSLQAIGEDFNVDWVIEVAVLDFQVTDPKSPYLFQGKANVAFKVHDVKRGALAFETNYKREFPKDRYVSVNDIGTEDAFRQSFLRVIAKELSWYVVPRAADEVNKDPF